MDTTSVLQTQSFSDFKTAQKALTTIVNDWEDVVKDTEHVRELRYLRYTTSDELRADAKLLADESYIPTRVMDANIRREQPQFIAYLTQSRRSVVFNSIDGLTDVGTDQLDILFTNKSRYIGWETPFIRMIDGCQQHGWDSVEVVFDPTMPGHFAIEYVGHDNLIFPLDTENIQQQPIIARKIQVTGLQLGLFVEKNGFNRDEVEKLQQANTDATGVVPSTKFYDIYKVFYKENGVVYFAYTGGRSNSDWLLPPQRLYLGRHDVSKPMQPVVNEVGDVELDEMGQPIRDYVPIYETEYPFYVLTYVMSEDCRITKVKGRGHLDEPAQSAASSLLSALVNGTYRAAGVYCSPSSDNASQPSIGAPKQLDTVLESGRIYDRPLTFWHPAYPDMSVINAFQTVVRANEQESSKVDYSVLNRKDSGKTATEVDAARQEAAKLSSVQVTLLSIFIRSLYARCWSILQNRVTQGKIEVVDAIKKYFFTVDQMSGAISIKMYVIKSAGDVDVVQKAEKLQRMMQFWTVVNKTAIANEFLKDIIRVSFPEDSEKYVGLLDQAEQQAMTVKNNMIMKLASLVKELAVDSQTGQIRPELQQLQGQLQQLVVEVQQAIGAGQIAPENPQQ